MGAQAGHSLAQLRRRRCVLGRCRVRGGEASRGRALPPLLVRRPWRALENGVSVPSRDTRAEPRGDEPSEKCYVYGCECRRVDGVTCIAVCIMRLLPSRAAVECVCVSVCVRRAPGNGEAKELRTERCVPSSRMSQRCPGTNASNTRNDVNRSQSACAPSGSNVVLPFCGIGLKGV